jgi:CRISPR-associated protein Csm5
MTLFNLKITTLSPIHIGDGGELRHMFDFVIKAGKTYRLNENAILHAKEERLKPQRDGTYPLPGALLDAPDWENPSLFRYIIPGVPRAQKEDARLKGALRTALAWTGWSEVAPRVDRAAIGNNRSWAGQPLERKLFGADPNHDLLRALRVSDCIGEYKPGEKIFVVNAQVLTERNQGSPVELEAIASEAVFNGSLEIDDLLFSPEFEKTLHFKDRKHWLDQVLVRAQKHSQARIQELAAWFGAVQGCEGITNFYHRLAGVSLGNNQALMQVGWGTGWDGKTFWTHLKGDHMLFSRLVNEFRMQKKGRDAIDRPVDRFPASRRVAMKVKEGVSKPAAPFGWMLVELDNKE